MNIVLDTNVLVAGLLTPYGPCGEIVRMISSGEMILCFDARILAEYNEVLRRPKFNFDEDRVAALVDFLAHNGCAIASHPLPKSLPDSDDEPLLEVALSGKESVACLVTGNKMHFPLKLRQGVKVFSPREFSDFMRKQHE